MDVATLLAAIGAVGALATVLGLRWQRNASRPATIAQRTEQFRVNYDELAQSQIELSNRAFEAAPSFWKPFDIPLLTRRSWIPDAPVSISQTTLKFTSAVEPRANLRVPKFGGLSPAKELSYSSALKEVVGMNFTPGVVYRPVQLELSDAGLRAEFRQATYFDYLDTGEVLSYLEQTGTASRHRRKLGDPFDLSNRIASLGVLTLTIVGDHLDEASFYMHQRSAAVSLGTGLYHVVPAGEFAPSDKSLSALKDDLDVWSNIAREYAEEFLGDDDAQGEGGKRIDYRGASPYKEMLQAQHDDTLSISMLGLGLDPLTWKPELLTVAVFTSAAFESAFGKSFKGNSEGLIVENERFDEATINAYLQSQRVRPGARACLGLAWRQRRALPGLRSVAE